MHGSCETLCSLGHCPKEKNAGAQVPAGDLNENNPLAIVDQMRRRLNDAPKVVEGVSPNFRIYVGRALAVERDLQALLAMADRLHELLDNGGNAAG